MLRPGPVTAPPDTLKAGRLLATTLLAALLGFTGYFFVWISVVGTLEGWAVGAVEAVATVFTVLLVFALVPLARGGAPIRWPHTLAATLFGLSLLPIFGAFTTLAEPLVTNAFGTCGTAAFMQVLGAPVVALAGGLVGFAAAYLGVRELGVWGARLVRGASLATLVGVASLVAVTGVSVTSRPRADEFLAVMSVAGELPAVTLSAGSDQVETVGSLTVWRRCEGYECKLALGPPAAEPAKAPGIPVRAGALRVRVDPALDLVVFEDIGPSPGRMHGVLQLGTGQPTSVTWTALDGRVAPPLAYFLCALAGLVLAAAAFACSRRAAPELRGWRAARAATLCFDGTVLMHGKTAVTAAQDVSDVEPGPVLVLADGQLRAGTRADLEASIAVAAAGPFALAAAVALWSALPLALVPGLDPYVEAVLWTPSEVLLMGVLAIVCVFVIVASLRESG